MRKIVSVALRFAKLYLNSKRRNLRNPRHLFKICWLPKTFNFYAVILVHSTFIAG